jgi:phosphoribosylanthranilate isomerase
MTTAVKICGLKTEAALEAALAGGADFVGLVFYPRSPRNVDLVAAARLADLARGRARIVALMVDPEDALVDQIVRDVRPDLLQLHGQESAERCRDITARTGLPVMKAIKVATAADAQHALAYRDVCEMILFDAKAPPGLAGALPGGNGLAFDWTAIAGVAAKVRYMLSGGLTPETVATAIAVTGAPAVDVSSGVESRPGEKDPELIRRFLQAAKRAN